MAQLAWVPVEATPVSCESRVAIAQRISSLLREREANRKALRTAGARFKPPQTPVPTYRGLFGPLGVDVDPEWIREMIPHFSPRSRCGRRLRRHLRLYEEHIANMYADREASGIGPLIDEQNSIEGELEAVAKEACSLIPRLAD